MKVDRQKIAHDNEQIKNQAKVDAEKESKPGFLFGMFQEFDQFKNEPAAREDAANERNISGWKEKRGK